jgi:hypothetical protein
LSATTDAAMPRLWRVEAETLVRSDGFVVIAQRDEMGCEQLLILEREQLREIAADVEKCFRAHERRQRKAVAA